jgi:ketosteroid isomerase-like protein
MKRFLLAALLLCALAPLAHAQQQKKKTVDVAAELQSLVRAERAFAGDASVRGTREAFLAALADDGVVFRGDGPVNGKKFFTESPARPGLLSWDPVYADVARAGDLGYTTGPWEFRPKGPEDKPVAFGYFMTVWRKQADGTWKFALDLGTGNPEPKTLPPALSYSRDFRQNNDRDKLDVNTERTARELLKLEGEYSKASEKDAAAAFASFAAADVRLMREGNLPVTDKASAEKALAAVPGALTWEPSKVEASHSGDLGYSYGTYELKRAGVDDKAAQPERGNYVHIWKKKPDGKWRVVLDLLKPFPPPRQQ